MTPDRSPSVAGSTPPRSVPRVRGRPPLHEGCPGDRRRLCFPDPGTSGPRSSVPVPVGDSGSMSRYQIVLLCIGPTGSGYRPSTGQTIVRKSPPCCDGASPDSGSESLGQLQRKEAARRTTGQTAVFRLPGGKRRRGIHRRERPAPGLKPWAKQADFRWRAESTSLVSLCAAPLGTRRMEARSV